MVHKSPGAALDRPDTVHCADLRDVLVDKFALLQLGEYLHLLLLNSRCLWGVRNIQLLVAVLWVLGRWGQHYVGDPRQTHSLVLHVRHLLLGREDVHDWLPAILQTGDAAVLPGEAIDGLHHHIPPGLRSLPRRRLVCEWRLHLHDHHLQYQCIVGAVRPLSVLLCDPRSPHAVRSCVEVLHGQVGDLLIVLARRWIGHSGEGWSDLTDCRSGQDHISWYRLRRISELLHLPGDVICGDRTEICVPVPGVRAGLHERPEWAVSDDAVDFEQFEGKWKQREK